MSAQYRYYANLNTVNVTRRPDPPYEDLMAEIEHFQRLLERSRELEKSYHRSQAQADYNAENSAMLLDLLNGRIRALHALLQQNHTPETAP